MTVGEDTHALAVTGTFADDGFEAQVVAEVTGSQDVRLHRGLDGHSPNKHL